MRCRYAAKATDGWISPVGDRVGEHDRATFSDFTKAEAFARSHRARVVQAALDLNSPSLLTSSDLDSPPVDVEQNDHAMAGELDESDQDDCGAADEVAASPGAADLQAELPSNGVVYRWESEDAQAGVIGSGHMLWSDELYAEACAAGEKARRTYVMDRMKDTVTRLNLTSRIAVFELSLDPDSKVQLARLSPVYSGGFHVQLRQRPKAR